jgi:hypothetical protein
MRSLLRHVLLFANNLTINRLQIVPSVDPLSPNRPSNLSRPNHQNMGLDQRCKNFWNSQSEIHNPYLPPAFPRPLPAELHFNPPPGDKSRERGSGRRRLANDRVHNETATTIFKYPIALLTQSLRPCCFSSFRFNRRSFRSSPFIPMARHHFSKTASLSSLGYFL